MGTYGSSIIHKKGTKLENMLHFDQTICGKNVTRVGSNVVFRRKYLNIDDPYPVVSDRLVCPKK